MSVDERGFRRALSRFATGVTVVTSRDAAGRPVGLTVNSFCSVSLEPPLVLVCIDRRSETVRALAETAAFNLSVLAEHQEEISCRFARHHDSKFDGIEMAAGTNGLPLVPGALAELECKVVASHPTGDHIVYVAETTRVSCVDGRPLLYFASAYRRLDPENGTPAA
jgi:flavin reductase (DIM6/NTAB) family NADH-FMN oxidoreductase RutF